jgi:hypothetical protein
MALAFYRTVETKTSPDCGAEPYASVTSFPQMEASHRREHFVLSQGGRQCRMSPMRLFISGIGELRTPHPNRL